METSEPGATRDTGMPSRRNTTQPIGRRRYTSDRAAVIRGSGSDEPSPPEQQQLLNAVTQGKGINPYIPAQS
jgi:hypothetical protein